MRGKLYVCGTPIGNLEDITYRVLSTLKVCDVIYAEDTRHSIKLLNHFDIKKPLHSYHEHNLITAGLEIIEKIKSGQQVGLISDAGMPGISDPGENIIKLCIENELDFEVIPGVTAFTTALVGSGLDTSRFVFEGFLSRDKRQKKKMLERLKKETRTLLFYESPHRLKDTLKHLLEIFGDRKMVVARELTKKFETYQRGSISELIRFYAETEVKGEIVLVIEGYEETDADRITYDPEESVIEHVRRYMEEGNPRKDALKRVAVERNMKKSEVYALLIDEDL